MPRRFAFLGKGTAAMLRMIVVTTLSVVLCANAVHAQEFQVVASLPAAPIHTSVANVRFDVPYTPRFGSSQRSSKRNSTAQKVTAGFALGFLGLLGGAALGASFDRNCGCDDPGLKGAIIGAPIGAIGGAIAGFLLASR